MKFKLLQTEVKKQNHNKNFPIHFSQIPDSPVKKMLLGKIFLRSQPEGTFKEGHCVLLYIIRAYNLILFRLALRASNFRNF